MFSIRFLSVVLAAAASIALAVPGTATAGVVLYNQNFENPSGGTALSGNGTVLDFAQITGVASSSRSQFNWTEHTVALNASGSATGNVTVRIDLLNTLGSEYAAFDNFLILASDTPGDLGGRVVPEPASITIFGVGLAALLTTRRRSRPAEAPPVAGCV